MIFGKQQRWAEAETCYRHSLRLNPRAPETFNNLGVSLLNQGILAEALTSFKRSRDAVDPITAKPIATSAWPISTRTAPKRWLPATGRACSSIRTTPTLTITSAWRWRPGTKRRGAGSYREGLRIKPEHAEIHNNLGYALAEQGRFDGGSGQPRHEAAPSPNYPEPHFVRSMIYLLQGDFATGWAEYQWREHARSSPSAPSPSPCGTAHPWKGAPSCCTPSKDWATPCTSSAMPPWSSDAAAP